MRLIRWFGGMTPTRWFGSVATLVGGTTVALDHGNDPVFGLGFAVLILGIVFFYFGKKFDNL